MRTLVQTVPDALRTPELLAGLSACLALVVVLVAIARRERRLRREAESAAAMARLQPWLPGPLDPKAQRELAAHIKDLRDRGLLRDRY